ncbi:MAG: universal stress protein [Akkermansiaceae bacterium]|jgi:nucleotide-binding universal stress UspA family protein|nr:universal stress protein [Akkermansiaceae bacterium]
MKTIVVALDFSDASGPVLEFAAKMAGVFGATLHLVHVVEPEPTYSAYGFTPEEFPAIHVFQKEARSRAESALNEKRKTLSGDLKVETHLLEGNPKNALLEFGTEVEADVMVLGSHGHGVVASMLLGSVTEGLVRKAEIPVLVIPAPHRK